jgi:hypothetical protein
MPKPPNPGSDAAVIAGCTCPIVDNNSGEFPPFEPDSWYMTEGCPVHRPPSQEGWGRSEH